MSVFLCAAALIVVWSTRIILALFTSSQWGWRHLVIPVVGVAGLSASTWGLPAELRWSVGRPYLERAAQAALIDPRAEFRDDHGRRVDTFPVTGTAKEDGIVRFTLRPGGSVTVFDYAYVPDARSRPPAGGGYHHRHIDGPWWLEIRD
ncbi:hypothetical protein P0W64_16245 [Tsukamurella sp. 8F]|uniref:hypothetical protein n=1 Tax=unclassified Tsukamurella TaxID=2633480 RepID=UPI0023B8F53A|nr:MULTISPECIES: hypothetical protein [unclassified Tsukamurella]MDF0530806.1 hypothetical protein [Tsukamurella sp. 8J]MDF0588332.1 hypothetical protein [Tsukamurella sp. 8F]